MSYINSEYISGGDIMGGECIPYETPIYPSRLAEAYVPKQIICSCFEPLEGLKKGTIFADLYSPYK